MLAKVFTSFIFKVRYTFSIYVKYSIVIFFGIFVLLALPIFSQYTLGTPQQEIAQAADAAL